MKDPCSSYCIGSFDKLRKEFLDPTLMSWSRSHLRRVVELKRMGKKRSKKLEPYTLENITLEKFVNGGQALGYSSDGKPVFVWGALAIESVGLCRARH
jgi:hypothetical protein